MQYTHTHTHIHTHTHTHTDTDIDTHTHTHTFSHAYRCVKTFQSHTSLSEVEAGEFVNCTVLQVRVCNGVLDCACVMVCWIVRV
jgi:hypothetical protein